jgi:hypothetical protein
MNTKTLLAIVVIATTAALTALGSLGIGTAIIAPASAQNMSGGGNMTAENMTADTSDSTSTPSGEAGGAGEGSTGGDGEAGGYQQ